MQNERLIEKLNSTNKFTRGNALKELLRRENSDAAMQPSCDASRINLNIHSDNSFAPYSATLAAYMAHRSGLKLVSLCDYGTFAGEKEFLHACKKLNMAAIRGFELTVKNENLGGRFVVALYCLSDGKVEKNYQFMLDKFRKVCFLRVRDICKVLNRKLKKHGINIDFERDVIRLSNYKKGGTLTLKHLYMAVGRKIIEKFGEGRPTADFLKDTLGLNMDETLYDLLCDKNNPFYIYDLIMELRENIINFDSKIDPPDMEEYFSVANDDGGIIKAYQYDCKLNLFTDSKESEEILEDFKNKIETAKDSGFNAVCIAGKNLSSSLLIKFVKMLEERELLAIFTEKTEYPRNHFECAIPNEAKKYIETCAYAMLGNAKCMENGGKDGLFDKKSALRCDNFAEKLKIYSTIGRNLL